MINAGQEGASRVELCCLLGISRNGYESLLSESEQFKNTDHRAKLLSEVWWERQGRRMTTGGDGNSLVWKFNMQNRFGWRDKQEVDNTSSDGSMTPKPAVTVTPDMAAEILKKLNDEI